MKLLCWFCGFAFFAISESMKIYCASYITSASAKEKLTQGAKNKVGRSFEPLTDRAGKTQPEAGASID